MENEASWIVFKTGERCIHYGFLIAHYKENNHSSSQQS